MWSIKVQDPVSVHDDLTHLALDVIGQAAFGYNFNTVLAGESKVSEAVTVVTGGMSIRYLLLKSLIPFFTLLPIGETRRIKAARETADNTVLEVGKTFYYILNIMIGCESAILSLILIFALQCKLLFILSSQFSQLL